jgi:photosystem II stability/assembly factor-like uncharacterized protein
MWALSTGRGIFVTHDAGRSWRKIRMHGLPGRVTIEKIVFSSSRIGWAILGPHFEGEYGSSLVRTTDGGLHWTPAGPRLPRHKASRR